VRLLGAGQVRVTFVCTSLLSGIEPPLHLVAANLPYVPAGEIEGLAPSVRRFEPLLALDGGADGLDHYRALLPQVAARLARGGTLLMECDPRQSALLRKLAAACFPQTAVTVLRDLAGLDRVIEVRGG
jgi:release factor glutamine methyltransferase